MLSTTERDHPWTDKRRDSHDAVPPIVVHVVIVDDQVVAVVVRVKTVSHVVVHVVIGPSSAVVPIGVVSKVLEATQEHKHAKKRTRPSSLGQAAQPCDRISQYCDRPPLSIFFKSLNLNGYYSNL